MDGISAVEKKIKSFKANMLSLSKPREVEDMELIMCRYLAYGSASYIARDLSLGDYSLPDYAGMSILFLRGHLQSVPSYNRVSVNTPDGKGRSFKEGGWDLKYDLEKAMKKLELDTWGLNFDDFKHPDEHIRPDKATEALDYTGKSEA